MNGAMQDAVDFLYDLPRFTKKNPLAHTRRLMELLDCPCEDRRVIHVAGSNGKGSVCNFLYHMLLAGGISAAMFTSPHLTDLRERFQINGRPVSEEAFLAAYDRVTQAVRGMVDEGAEHPTFFEFVYALAMVLFAKSGVACVILETGMGGRLDATNCFPAPILSVITPIALEHTEILGDTLEQIAAEKAGILKPGVPLVYAAGAAPDGTTDGHEADGAADIIAERAQMLFCPAVRVAPGPGGSGAASLADTAVFFQIEKRSADAIDFSLITDYDKKTIWHLPGRALYQVQNAALAVTAMHVLCGVTRAWSEHTPAAGEVFAIPDAILQQGLLAADWPGRMQEVMPDIFFDGAHNPAGIAAFLASAREVAREDAHTPLLLFSMAKEKNLEEAAVLLLSGMRWDAVAVTALPGERGADPAALVAAFARAADSLVSSPACSLPAAPEVFPDPRMAFVALRERKKPGQKLFCIGSLYLIGELLHMEKPGKWEDDHGL